MLAFRQNLKGLLFVSPWLIGFLVFSLYPMIMAIGLAFTNYNILQPNKITFTGFANVTRSVNNPLFWKSLSNTGFMTIIGVPLLIVLSLLIALPLNHNMRGISFYCTAIYLPVLLAPMVVVLLFLWILNPNYGLLKRPFDALGIQSPGWLADPIWSKPAMLSMVLWNTVGQVMVITLAGLRDIPKHLYEAAAIDGAGCITQFTYITLSGLSAVIFYNALKGILAFVQIFTQAFVSSMGGRAVAAAERHLAHPSTNSTLMISLHIYKIAFYSTQAGYAAMLSLVILAISRGLAFLPFRYAQRYVYYEFTGNSA